MAKAKAKAPKQKPVTPPPQQALRSFRFKGAVGNQQIGASYEEAHHPTLVATQRQARDGMRGVVKQYGELVEYIEGITPDIMLLAMREPYELSQIYVPKKTGALKDSGYLVISERGSTPAVEIGYARGGVPDYAALQHENLEFHHAPPTRAKFLQEALDETYGVVWSSIINMLATIAGGGYGKITAKMVRPSGVRIR